MEHASTPGDVTPPVVDARHFAPWSPNNAAISDAEVAAVLARHGVAQPPRDCALFRRACVHASYTAGATAKAAAAAGGAVREPPAGAVPPPEHDSERLEFVGDALLGAVIAHYLYERFPDSDEGFYTRLRTGLVNNAHLATLADAAGLTPWLLASAHADEVLGVRRSAKVRGSLLEAWVGAVYAEAEAAGTPGATGAAWERARAFVVGVIEAHVDFAKLVAYDANHKEALFHVFRERFREKPAFPVLALDGGAYTVGVRHPRSGELLATAKSKNRKAAEQEAARGALLALGVAPSAPPA
jgi:ribonuclease-3